jgi:hypothetical protein
MYHISRLLTRKDDLELLEPLGEIGVIRIIGAIR